jgi:hypothetical protein
MKHFSLVIDPNKVEILPHQEDQKERSVDMVTERMIGREFV